VVRGLAAVLMAACTAAAAPPRLVSATPDLGDDAVDPTITTLRLEFDQDMDTRGGMSLCGGGRTFPRITGKAKWESARVVLVPVALEPSHAYELSVNCPSARNFRSAAGEPAEVSPLSFRTAADKDAVVASHLTPEANREAITALLRTLDERYSHRDVRRVDWGTEVGKRAGELQAASTRGAFARTLASILSVNRDVHLWIRVGEARLGTFSPMQAPNCNVSALKTLVPVWTALNQTVFTGWFGGDATIGYIMISGWPSDGAAIGPAIEFLAAHADAAGMIVDVRANGGGDELTARAFASHLVDHTAVYSRNIYRDPGSPGGWGPMLDRTIEPAAEGARFAGRIAVLMGPCCMSSNESFLLMMRTNPRATLIGESSYGASGNPKPVELGNGVTVFMPSWKDLLPDGTPLEGRGVQPDVPIRARPDELESSDPVLDAALRVLRRPAP
jgi:hypothetical protein